MAKAGEGGASGESTLTVEEETSEFGFSSRRHNSGMIVLMASMAPLTSAAAGSKSKPLTHTPRQHQKWEPRNRQYNANLTNNHNHPFTSVDKDSVTRQAFHMGLMVKVSDLHNRYQGHPEPMDNETPSVLSA